MIVKTVFLIKIQCFMFTFKISKHNKILINNELTF